MWEHPSALMTVNLTVLKLAGWADSKVEQRDFHLAEEKALY